MVKSIQALRALGAILVFTHHFGFNCVLVTAAGDCAVAMFMMLSGYVLAMAYSRPGRVLPSVSGFMARRLINLYPLYFASIIISLLIDGLHPHTDMWYAVLADVLMIQSWIPDVKVYFACNAPVWFVSDLMLCYMLFLPVLKRVVGSRRSVLSNYIYCYRVFYGCACCAAPQNTGYNLHTAVDAVSGVYARYAAL